MSNKNSIRYDQEIPDVLSALMAVHRAVDSHGLDRTIHHLVLLRASQMNGCAHCLAMHLREARQHGETQERIDRVSVWRHVDVFSEAERAALAWTEALTALDPAANHEPLRARLREHFKDGQIAALTTTIGMINFWNRLQISQH